MITLLTKETHSLAHGEPISLCFSIRGLSSHQHGLHDKKKEKKEGKSCGRSFTFAYPLGARCNLATYVPSLIGWSWLNARLVFLEATLLDCLFGFAALL